MAVAPPPAALLQFLGEAPTQAALRRPGSSGSNAPPSRVPPKKSAAASSHRGKGEDSSPESDGGLPPCNDGGFDDLLDDGRAPQPETQAMPVAQKRTGSPRARQSGAAAIERPPRAPAVDGGTSPAGSTASGNTRRQGSQGGAARETSGSGSRGRVSASNAEAAMGKTCTPAPGSLKEMLGEASASAAVRHSSGGARPRSGSNGARQSGYGGNAAEGMSAKSNKERSLTPNLPDPMGMSGGQRKQRFGGRG